jgi:hypothetical protein
MEGEEGRPEADPAPPHCGLANKTRWKATRTVNRDQSNIHFFGASLLYFSFQILRACTNRNQPIYPQCLGGKSQPIGLVSLWSSGTNLHETATEEAAHAQGREK